MIGKVTNLMWKGTEVFIMVFGFNEDVIEMKRTYLDTDTMSDIFDKYPPSTFKFDIQPVPEDYDD